MKILQNEHFSCHNNDYITFTAMEPYNITRIRIRELDSLLTGIEKSDFMPLKYPLRWLGIAASPFGAFYSSDLLQLLPNAKVAVLSSQIPALKVLKKLSTTIHFPVPIKVHTAVNVSIFSDVERITEHGQLSYIPGL